MGTHSTLEVAGTSVPVSNLEKVYYPNAGFRKGDVLDYYVRISSVLLPHLKDRPITLKRYPDGVDGIHFYEKHCPSHRPSWIRTKAVAKAKGGEVTYCVLNNLSALIWAANLANLELHTFLHKARALTRPTVLAFDLDPGPPADLLSCCEIGLMLRDLFTTLRLKSYPKTSGSKGLQVYVPLNRATTYDRTKQFSRAVAETLEQQAPDKVVSRMQKSLRHGKVLVDWSQNDDHKTTVCVYSLRATDQPRVSTPLKWQEVETALRRGKASLLHFEPGAVLKRVAREGDLFSEVLTVRQKLPNGRRDFGAKAP